MKKRCFSISAIFLGLVLLSTPLYAVPIWYIQNRANPDMFIGIGSAKIKDKDTGKAVAKAKQMAMQDACSSVSCNVQGQTSLTQTETDAGEDELFISESSIRTAVEAVNVEVLKSTIQKGSAFVMVGIPKDDLRKSYRLRVKEELQQVNRDFGLAEKFQDTSPRKAMEIYQRCLSGVVKLSNDLKVYIFLNNWKNDLQDEIKSAVSRQRIEKSLSALCGKTPVMPAELATLLLKNILPASPRKAKFVIYPVEYQNSGYVSQFGYDFTELLATHIIKTCGWQRVRNLNDADFLFRGKIIASGDGIELLLTMQSANSSKASELYVSKVSCDKIGWKNIRPKDLDKALKDKIALYKGLKSDIGLRVQLQTDKLADGPIVYRYGDRPKLALKVNRACYVRLIYIFSDGTKLLLMDNYHISDDMANEWQRLPINWEVCEPAGVEQMLVQATVNEKMPPLNIKRHNLPGGFYQDIIVDSVHAAVMKTRGCKMFKSAPVLTEVPYQWTIFEK